MKFFRVVFIVGLAASAARAKEKIVEDFLGAKGGVIEQLYSESGRRQIAGQVRDTLRRKNDGILFFFSDEDYSRVFIFAATAQGGGRDAA